MDCVGTAALGRPVERQVDRILVKSFPVQADFAVELGKDDEVIDIPWSAGGDGPRYYDLKRHPELLDKIEEAAKHTELRDFLRAVNSSTSLETAKCDAWSSTEINPEEEIFGAAVKFGSYVDLLFSDPKTRSSFPEHEQWAKRLTDLLKKVPEIPAAAEFLVRRCYFQAEGEAQEGLYLTFYQFGYGGDEAQARLSWAIGLKLVENAIRQVAR